MKCRFCSKIFDLARLKSLYEANLYCCRSQYLLRRFNLNKSFDIIDVLFDIFNYEDVQYSAKYNYCDDKTYFVLNNTKDFLKNRRSYSFDGFVSVTDFKKLMKLKAFW